MHKMISSPLAHVLAAALLVTGISLPAAAATSRDEQGAVRKEMRAGNVMRLRDIESRVLPQMRDMEYLGPAYDSVAKAYRLKFIKDGRVVFVDIDARTGRVLSRTR